MGDFLFYGIIYIMIRNVVFDVGSVLVDELGAKSQKHLTQQQIDNLQKIIFSKEFEAVILGDMTTAQYIEGLIKDFPQYEQEVHTILDFRDQKSISMPKRPEMVDLLYRIRQNGYKVFFLSDMIDATYNYLRDILEDFDGGVFSYQEHVRKPNVKIFEILINRYNLDVAETIFFDDKPSNVDAAKSLGMQAVVFTNINDVLNALSLNYG